MPRLTKSGAPDRRSATATALAESLGEAGRTARGKAGAAARWQGDRLIAPRQAVMYLVEAWVVSGTTYRGSIGPIARPECDSWEAATERAQAIAGQNPGMVAAAVTRTADQATNAAPITKARAYQLRGGEVEAIYVAHMTGDLS